MTVSRQDGRAERDSTKPLATAEQIEAAMNKGIRQALRRHKLLGESIAVSQDGKVVILSPEEIPDFPEEETPARSGTGQVRVALIS
jgi:hypothetical protein